jgi:Uma2 family endonuclease
MTLHTRLTAREFETYALLPENVHRRLELVGGEVVEVVSDSYASMIAMIIGIEIGIYLKTHPIGFLTGMDGGYAVGNEHYIPDLGFIRPDKKVRAAYNPNPPDLAVEVLSPSDNPNDLMIKVVNYITAGTVVWVVYPNERKVEVYTPGKPVQILTGNDTLGGDDVLPDFAMTLPAIFAPLDNR